MTLLHSLWDAIGIAIAALLCVKIAWGVCVGIGCVYYDSWRLRNWLRKWRKA